MKYRHVQETVDSLRALADYLEAHGLELPKCSPSIEINCYLSETDYVRNPETNEYESIFKEDETKENLRRFLLAIGSCDKNYSDDRLIITKSFGKRAKIRGSVDRQLTCRKVVKGQRLQQAHMIPAKMVDEVEWVCDENQSLLKLVS